MKGAAAWAHCREVTRPYRFQKRPEGENTLKDILKSERIETERLTLRAYREEDLPALTELLRDPLIQKTFMIPVYETDAEYEALALKLIAFSQPADTKHLEYGIYRGDRLIGFINDCGFDDSSIELGYFIAPRYWGSGYATEALRAVLDDLRRMGFSTVKAGFFEENPASSRVMEKCGMVLTGEAGTEEYRGSTHRVLYRAITF